MAPAGSSRKEIWGFAGSDNPNSRPDAPHWRQVPENYPVPADQLIRLPTANPKKLPRIQFDPAAVSAATHQPDHASKLKSIKAAFVHAWTGYVKNALPHDELRPIRGSFRDPFNGWGATLVDSLDSLWILGLREEFDDAVDAVERIDFTTSHRPDIPLFETVIRYLGGLISAYDLSAHPVLLAKAVELGDVLYAAFDTPNRMPMTFFRWDP
jgi:mannosyl-oligosaccharide alpha-1,2-mannosidase